MEDLGHIRHLYRKYIDDRIDHAERSELYRFFREADDATIGEVIGSYLYGPHALPDLSHLSALTGRVFQRVAALTDPQAVPQPIPSRRHWKPLVAAATVLALLSVSLLFYLNDHPTGIGREAAAIEAGTNRATLTLADGRTIDLSEAQAGIIVSDGITYLDGTKVIENEKWKVENDGAAFNSITTPKGGTYSITLPDGSKVWLNANSTLTYPSRFSGDSREVILEGEAFFAVSPTYRTGRHRLSALGNEPSTVGSGSRASVTRVPFKVQTSGQTVEVLGTQFNVNAYTNEPAITTSLLEGKVRVIPATRDEAVELLPGQQARFLGGQLGVGMADVSALVSWTKDVFVFQNTDLANVVRQLERWYDVRYEGDPLPDIRYYAMISRKVSLLQVLELLEETGNVRFQVKERRIMLRK